MRSLGLVLSPGRVCDKLHDADYAAPGACGGVLWLDGNDKKPENSPTSLAFRQTVPSTAKTTESNSPSRPPYDGIVTALQGILHFLGETIEPDASSG